MKQIDENVIFQSMTLLGNLMEVRKRPRLHLVICGGSALIALKLVARTTKDVDVLATFEDGILNCARPLPDWLREDAAAVQVELKLPENWLNDGPADESLFRLGLPAGVVERLVTKQFGPMLTVSFISRYDQIHFKLYAAADQGGRHFTDLQKLSPVEEELHAAIRWVFTQDDSAAFHQLIAEVLNALGHGKLIDQI